MAKTNGTNPYSGSPGEPRCSGRNRKHAHETGGARKPWKNAVPKGQRKDPPELLTYLHAQAQLPRKDQELLSSDSDAVYLRPVGAYLCKPAELQLKHHHATVSNLPTHLNAQAQLQCKDQDSLSVSPPQAGMPTLIPLAQVDMTSESEQRYPILPNRSALYTSPKKILARLKEGDVTDISPYNHNMPPSTLQLSVDMISYAKTAIEGNTSEYDEQDHLTKKKVDNNNGELSEVDDDDRDEDYKQVESSEDDNNLSLAARKLVLPTSFFDYSDNEFDHLLDDKELDENAKRIEYANSRKRETIGRSKGTLLRGGPHKPSYEGMMAGKEKAAREEYQNKRKKWRDQTRSERLRANNMTNFNDDDFTGNFSPTLHTMSDVCAAHLERGHSFPDQNLVTTPPPSVRRHQQIPALGRDL
jgi:hypothetical protein